MSRLKWVLILLVGITLIIIPLRCILWFYKEFIPQWQDQKRISSPAQTQYLVLQDMVNTVLTPYSTRLLIEQKSSGQWTELAVVQNALSQDIDAKWISEGELEITIPKGVKLLDQHIVSLRDSQGKSYRLTCRFKIENVAGK